MDFPALDAVTRTHLSTAEAAYHLGLRPQTLRMHACYETGPVRPIRVCNRLLWPVTEIKKVLGVAK